MTRAGPMWRRAASSSSAVKSTPTTTSRRPGIVHHGHPGRQPVVVPDEVRGAEQGQQRERAVEPAPGRPRGQPGRGLGRIGGRLGEEPERDREGHVDRELDQQVVEPGVGGVELEGGPGHAEPDARRAQIRHRGRPPPTRVRAQSAHPALRAGRSAGRARGPRDPPQLRARARPRSRSAVTHAPPVRERAQRGHGLRRSRCAQDLARAHVAAPTAAPKAIHGSAGLLSVASPNGMRCAGQAPVRDALAAAEPATSRRPERQR